MHKVVLIPDSFKGTMSSSQICDVLRARIIEHFPSCSVVSIPVADGGEGSVDAFLTALGGRKVELDAEGPFFDMVKAFYGIINDGRTAVVEMAACAGLPLVEGRRDPRATTTFGVGRSMKAAAESGASELIVGLGGSCTNDGACGAASACGVRFLDSSGAEFVPTGGTLSRIASIDVSGLDPALRKIKITAMCDIDNPMFGPEGAAHIFGPQKGADPACVEELDAGVKHLADVIEHDLGQDLSKLPGGGAAGAMGAGMVAFFGAQLKMGIDTVLDTVAFDEIVRDADAVITGEGKIDGQSLRGKVVIGVARRASRASCPTIAIVGGADYDVSGAYDEGVSAIFTINRLPQDFSILRERSRENLEFAADNVIRLIKTFSRRADL